MIVQSLWFMVIVLPSESMDAYPANVAAPVLTVSFNGALRLRMDEVVMVLGLKSFATLSVLSTDAMDATALFMSVLGELKFPLACIRVALTVFILRTMAFDIPEGDEMFIDPAVIEIGLLIETQLRVDATLMTGALTLP